jgi:uncharacterized protein
MSRLLFLAVVAFVVYWLLKSYRKQLLNKDDIAPHVDDMVRCEYCGVHVPKRESILTEGKYFCGQEHRRLYAESQNKT